MCRLIQVDNLNDCQRKLLIQLCFCKENKKRYNTVWTEFCFIYGVKHILSLRLTFCLSPQTQIVYFYIFWSIKAMLSSQCGLQYCKSSQHKQTCFIFPFFTLVKQETDTTSERWPLNIRKQPSVWLKIFVWFNLSSTLYVCSHAQMCVTSCRGILYTNNSIFELYGSRNSTTLSNKYLIRTVCMCVWPNFHHFTLVLINW